MSDWIEEPRAADDRDVAQSSGVERVSLPVVLLTRFTACGEGDAHRNLEASVIAYSTRAASMWIDSGSACGSGVGILSGA